MKRFTLILLALATSLSLAAQEGAPEGAESEIPDYTQYILTPPAPETPRINGARIFGVRPNSEFLYTIPATGRRPMTFSAKGLPSGLRLDAATGRITGKTKRRGVYEVMLTAKNKLGSDSRAFRIVVGDDISLTPPMGWNSWNCWGKTVSAEGVLSSARAMVEKGLVNYGWTYINIDDGWQGERGGIHNAIQPNSKFPDMKALADELHAMGLKLGIYSTPWVGSYAGHIGSYADREDGKYDWIERKEDCNEYFCNIKNNDTEPYVRREKYHHGKVSFVKADAAQWAEWGIDYLKYDWNPNNLYHVNEMEQALKELPRDIVYSLSNNAPFGDAWHISAASQCYRTTGDIRDTWSSISKIGFSQEKWAAYTRPGHWADPDMLVVGRVGWGRNPHNTKLTPDEQYTHISLWSLLAAPMLIGCDMAQMDNFTVSLLTNNEVIDVNQDALGIHAATIYEEGDIVILAKPLEDGSMAVGMFNRGETAQQIKLTLKMIGMRGDQMVRDLWRQKDIVKLSDNGSFVTTVAPHGVSLVKIYPGNSREREMGYARDIYERFIIPMQNKAK